jgi:hypothetical protein
MRKTWRYALVAFVAAWVGYAVAQPVIPTGLNGLEAWSCGTGGPGGPSVFCTTNLLRNTTGYQLLAAASGTIQPTVSVNTLAVNAQPAASTAFQTPPSPVPDGSLFQVCNVTASAWATNASTLAAATGQTINGGTITTTTLAAHTCVELLYQLSSTTWFQIR